MPLLRRRRTQALPPPAYAGFLNVLLVLMAFASVYIVLGRSGALGVELPGCGGESRPARVVVATLTARHCFYWGKEGPIPLDQFPARLVEERRLFPNTHFVIASDTNALLGDAVQVLDTVRQHPEIPVTLETTTRSGP